MTPIKACIFDLEGVICNTMRYHFKAWRRLAENLGFDLTEEKVLKMKGLTREESLNLILNWASLPDKSEEEKTELAAQKNTWYLEFISSMTQDEVLMGVKSFLDDVKKRGLKIGLGTESKNANFVLEKLNLTNYFDVVVDGTVVSAGKPNVEIFNRVAEALEVKPKECLVFEDSDSGIDAAADGGFYTVAVGAQVYSDEAHITIPSFEYIDFEEVMETLTATTGMSR